MSPVLCCCALAFVPLAPWSAGGGERGGAALSYVYANSGVCGSHAGCVSCELVCVCVLPVRVVIICLASTHTALVSRVPEPDTVLHLSTYIHTYAGVPVVGLTVFRHQEYSRTRSLTSSLQCVSRALRGGAGGAVGAPGDGLSAQQEASSRGPFVPPDPERSAPKSPPTRPAP